jgi:peptidoglycan/LPS O-acetylase OafA/YrhL
MARGYATTRPARRREPVIDPLSDRARADLDMLRGVSALVVLATHVRQMFFASAHGGGLVARALFAFASHGHDAVLAFLVLSGYLVTRSTLSGPRDRRWAHYAVARSSRILTVLWPAFALGISLDWIGLERFGGAAIYSGSHPAQVFAIDIKERLSGTNVIGNLVFLQGIRVPPLGSNVALWTLAYEGWFYVAFPFVVVLMTASSTRKRALAVVALAAIVVAVGPLFPAYFAVWSMGAIVAVWERRAPGTWPGVTRIAAIALVIASLLARTVVRPEIVRTELFALALAVAIAAFTRAPSNARRPRVFRSVATALAAISYSLYVVHVPALALAAAVVAVPPLLAPTAENLACVAPIVALVIAYAVAVHVVVERRTPAVRRWLSRRFALDQRSQ